MSTNFKNKNQFSNLTRPSQSSRTLEDEDEIVFLCELKDNQRRRKGRLIEVKKEVKQEKFHQEEGFEEVFEVEEITGIKEVKVKSLKKEKQELAKEVLKAKKKVKEREEDVASCDNAAMLSNDEGPIPFNLFTTPDVVLDVNENIYGSPPPFQTLNDVSTLADEDAIEDQETLSISIKQEDDLVSTSDDSESDEEVRAPPQKKARQANRSFQGDGMIHLFTKASDQEPSVDGIIKILRNTRNKQLEALFEGTSLQPGKTTATGREKFSTSHISAINPDKPVTFQAQTSDLADKAIQVDLPNLELANLKELVCEQESLLTKKNDEIQALKKSQELKNKEQQHLFAEQAKEIENLKESFKQKDESQQSLITEKIQEIESLKENLRQKCIDHERLVTEKNREIESLKESLKHKEIGFVAATSLLGLSLDECVRKSAEAQTAKAALEQQSIPAAVVPTQSPSVTQHTCCCASKKTGESNDRGSSTPIDLSSRRETCDAGNSQPVVSSSTSGPPWKDEFSRRDRQSVNGVYVDAFPLQLDILKGLASSSNAVAFVRAVMLHCFTDELLEKKTISQLNESHVDEITDATMANFTHYHTRKDSTAQSLNRPTVRTFISNMLQARKKQTQKRTRKT